MRLTNDEYLAAMDETSHAPQMLSAAEMQQWTSSYETTHASQMLSAAEMQQWSLRQLAEQKRTSIKSLVPCSTETDENVALPDNINEQDLPQHVPDDSTILAPDKCSTTAVFEDKQHMGDSCSFGSSDNQASQQQGHQVPNQTSRDERLEKIYSSLGERLDPNLPSVSLESTADGDVTRSFHILADIMSQPRPLEKLRETLESICAAQNVETAVAESALAGCMESDPVVLPSSGSPGKGGHGADPIAGTARVDEVGAIPARPWTSHVPDSLPGPSDVMNAVGRSSAGDAKVVPKFEVGQRVAYNSGTHKMWMQAVVKKVLFDKSGRVRAYDLDVKSGASESKIQKPEELVGLAGGTVEHVPPDPDCVASKAQPAARNSSLYNGVHTEEEPKVDSVSCARAPEYETKACLLEPSGKREDVEVTFTVGECVDYWSHSYDQWMPGVIECVRGDGSYDLDIKRCAQQQKIRKRPSDQGPEITEEEAVPEITKDEDEANTSRPSSCAPAPTFCPGPARQSWRRSSCPAAGDRGLPQTGSASSTNEAVKMPSADLVAPASAGAASGAEIGSWRAKSPIPSHLRASCSSAAPPAQYAHRALSTAPAEKLQHREQSPISGRRRGYSFEQPGLDVVSTHSAAAPSVRRGGVSQGLVASGLQGKNSYASPVLRNRGVMNDSTGAPTRASQALQSGITTPAPARGMGALENMLRQRDVEKVVRQTTGGEMSTSLQPPAAAPGIYMNCSWPAEGPAVVRTGGKVYANGAGSSSGTYFVNSSATVAAAIRARSRSIGRNSLVPERIVQEGTVTPPRCAMQGHNSARQFASVRGAAPTLGAQVQGNFSYNGGLRQLEVEDLAVGDGQFDPVQPSVRSQLIAKLHIQGDAELEEMVGFRGGLNDGVWFLTGQGRALVLKLVRGQRQHETVPTEAESFVKLSQEFPGIASDQNISFPIKIFRCVRPDGTKLHDLIVMTKAPGRRLAEITACMYHGNKIDSLMAIYNRVGSLLRELHTRYRNYQHSDFQPSNVLCDEETGRITLIDVGGMARGRDDIDLTHFRASMDILSRSYGIELVTNCLHHFQSGYDNALSSR